MFKGLIFDFNGVLWWDKELQEESWTKFAAKFRGYGFSPGEFEIHVHGRNMRYTLEYLAERSLNDAEVDELTEQKESIYRALCLEQREGFKLSPGARDLLDFLVEYRIRRTIATASGIKNLRFFIEHLGLERWFDEELMVYDDGSRPGKPAPDFYLQAAAKLNLSPQECVVIEDSQSGLLSAKLAGAGCIIALSPAQHRQDIGFMEGVNDVIEELSQLPRETLFLDSNVD